MAAVPPGYDPSAPPPQGYPPPTHAYPPQPGYPPPQQSYPPPGYPAQPAAQQQSNTNVVVVGGGAPAQQTTIIQQAPREKVNHVLHLILSCFIPGWIFVWMILCCIYGFPPAYDPNAPQGYAPQAYPPPTQGYGQAQQTATTNVVVVGQQAPVQQTTIIQQQQQEKVNHILHLIITLLFWPWVFVWMILCCIYGC